VTDTTEVVVVRAPDMEVDVRCGGLPFEPMEGATPRTAGVQPGFGQGSLLGRRYADEDLGLELLCTKSGPASISLGSEILGPKTSKPLPSSD
jgi:hypothetical protein